MSPSEADPSFDPSWFDRLEVELIGILGDIDVYQGFDGTSGRSWRIALGKSAAAIGWLEREFSLAGQLDPDSAWIPRALIDLGDRKALVFPGLEGQSIDSFVRPGYCPAVEEFLRIAVGASLALLRLHARKIVHRDIRPAALFLEATGKVRLACFGAAEFAAGQGVVLTAPRVSGDHLYAAPEQVRRNEAYCDYRSDLYSLGVVLYELASGTIPLKALSTPQWLHAQIAVQAVPPSVTNPAIPDILDAILLKLLAKDPSDRYQSATGLHADLVRCQLAWSAARSIERFQLGNADSSPRRAVSNKLFGRGPELALLLDAHARVAKNGGSEIVVLSGAPGAGKTALAAGLHRLLAQSETRLASGKGDLLQRAVPYAAITQVLRSLVTQVLGDSSEVLARIRQQLLASVGHDARSLVDLVPELEYIAGDAVFPAGEAEPLTQAGLQRAILGSLSAFAAISRPLVLFLDDLQWVDRQTLSLVAGLMHQAPASTLVILAYRSDAPENSGELRDLLASIDGASLPVMRVAIEPLGAAETKELVAGALQGIGEELHPLVEAVHGKTAGNPFYVIQVLEQLIDDGAVRYDVLQHRWTYDLCQAVYGEGVLDLMLHRLDALAPAAREMLRLIACAGGRCDEEVLTRLLGKAPPELEGTARLLMDTGFLSRRDVAYEITHDRILEAAYGLTHAGHRACEHARIARHMIEAYGEANADVIFEVAGQIEQAALGPVAPADSPPFVRALLAAARRAKGAAAADRSLEYLNVARAILAGAAIPQPAIAYEVELLNCECLVATGFVEEASHAIESLLETANDRVDRADLFRLKATTLTLKSDYHGAIDAALAGLRMLEIELDRNADEEQVDAAYRRLKQRLIDLPLDRFAALPLLEDRAIKSAVALLSTLISSMFVEGSLSILHTMKIVELTLDHGIARGSAYGLAWFGVLSAGRYGVYRDGFAYVSTAAKLAERGDYDSQWTAVLIAFDQVSPWTESLRFALQKARLALAAGAAAGDIAMMCYATNHIASDLIALGEPLTAIEAELEDGLARVRKLDYRDIEAILQAQLAFVQGLRGVRSAATPRIEPRQGYSFPARFFIAHYGGMTAFLVGDLHEADGLLAEALRLSWAAPAHIDSAYCHLFYALTAAQQNFAQGRAIERLVHCRAKFAVWAELNPGAFRGKLLLLDAELARLGDEPIKALSLYEQAAAEEKGAGFIQGEALVHELAGRFCRFLGLQRIADGHSREAQTCYRRWGAEAKARQLKVSGHFPSVERSTSVSEPAEVGQNELNLALVVKAAQTMSQELLPDRVIKTLVTDMMVHAGARYGVLLLLHDACPVVEARGQVVRDEIQVVLDQGAPTGDDVPVTVLNTVLRTQKAVVKSDAQSERDSGGPGWPSDRTVRSLVCQPLVKSGALIGILYLENNLAPGVFTAERTAMLDVLAPQIAVSLDAARLYRELAEENARRAQTETELRQARADLARRTHLTVMGELAASITHEINQPLTSIVAQAQASTKWLRRARPDVEEALSGLQTIRDEGMRAASIVKALRSLAKQAAPARSPIDLDELVRSVLRLIATEIESHGVRIAMDLQGDGSRIAADGVQIQQVILNIVTNALDAAAAVPIDRREVIVQSRDEHDGVRVSVRDFGPGIDAGLMDRIFDPLFSTKETGMGMGLAICRSIIEAHDGELDVVTGLGEGSTFSFRLPRLGTPSFPG
ncbi:trifunctional serine/threonine-protein kinase/ATP-binding protein/sensor histidine kinase [Bradyrhizobium ganzhouense]|uniref:trifunctional serine/threonine-protein kinase/ATP-binding protein/sensor histidine kinase n=1 Tax=Bradyrhizobium ganzhouense TaxID=1179767 RepID=UPI003CE92BA7